MKCVSIKVFSIFILFIFVYSFFYYESQMFICLCDNEENQRKNKQHIFYVHVLEKHILVIYLLLMPSKIY